MRARKSMSLVGRDAGACHSRSIKAPLRMNLSAYTDRERRYRNRSIAKYWKTSWNGRPVSFALFWSRWWTEAATILGGPFLHRTASR
jgi:hypothetical protein